MNWLLDTLCVLCVRRGKKISELKLYQNFGTIRLLNLSSTKNSNSLRNYGVSCKLYSDKIITTSGSTFIIMYE